MASHYSTHSVALWCSAKHVMSHKVVLMDMCGWSLACCSCVGSDVEFARTFSTCHIWLQA